MRRLGNVLTAEPMSLRRPRVSFARTKTVSSHSGRILQGFTGSAGSENELVARSFLINKIFDQWSVWFAELRPVAVAEGSVKVYGDDLICCCTHNGPPFFGLCIKPCFMCLSVLQFSGYVV